MQARHLYLGKQCPPFDIVTRILRLLSPGTGLVLPNESVSFQPQHGAELGETLAEMFVEDGRGISKVVAGSFFFSRICGLDAGAATAAGGRGNAATGAGYFQTADRNQYD
jgi:hypothetical protein